MGVLSDRQLLPVRQHFLPYSFFKAAKAFALVTGV